MWNKAGETVQGNLYRPLDGSHTPPFHEEGKEEGRGGEGGCFNTLLLNSATCSSLTMKLRKVLFCFVF